MQTEIIIIFNITLQFILFNIIYNNMYIINLNSLFIPFIDPIKLLCLCILKVNMYMCGILHELTKCLSIIYLTIYKESLK